MAAHRFYEDLSRMQTVLVYLYTWKFASKLFSSVELLSH